jgi:hypothetical protein
VVIVLAVVFVTALTAWAVWAAWSSGNPAIDAKLTRYQVVDDHEIRVQVSARFRDARSDGTCLVRATAEDHSIVGERNLTAAELRAMAGTWIPLRTERRATTADLVRCSG